jgi:hypothetical protein
MGPLLRSFATDARDCIMVRVVGPTEYKVAARVGFPGVFKGGSRKRRHHSKPDSRLDPTRRRFTRLHCFFEPRRTIKPSPTRPPRTFNQADGSGTSAMLVVRWSIATVSSKVASQFPSPYPCLKHRVNVLVSILDPLSDLSSLRMTRWRVYPELQCVLNPPSTRSYDAGVL